MNTVNKKVLIFIYSLLAVCLVCAVVLIIHTTKNSADTPQWQDDTAARTVAADTEADTTPGASVTEAPATAAPETSADVTSAEATTAGETSAVITTEELTTAAATEATEAVTTAAVQEPAFPLGIYIHDYPDTTYYKTSDFRSRWPENDNDLGRDANGNYDDWKTGYWTVDWWHHSLFGEDHLICDTKYFFVMPSSADSLSFSASSGSRTWAAEWKQLWTQAGLDGYKIGYEVETVLKNGTSSRISVLKPDKTFANAPYCEFWVYDELAKTDGMHVEEDEYTDSTLLHEIKLTLRNGCYDVDYFVLTAFVYKSDTEFDSDGFYTGINRTSCRISASNR